MNPPRNQPGKFPNCIMCGVVECRVCCERGDCPETICS
jgi:hypothetical protein